MCCRVERGSSRVGCATGRGNRCGAAGFTESRCSGRRHPVAGAGARRPGRCIDVVLSSATFTRRGAYGWPRAARRLGPDVVHRYRTAGARGAESGSCSSALEDHRSLLQGGAVLVTSRCAHSRRLRSAAPAARRTGDRGPAVRRGDVTLPALWWRSRQPAGARASSAPATCSRSQTVGGRRRSSRGRHGRSCRGPTPVWQVDRPRRGRSVPRADGRLVEGRGRRARPTVRAKYRLASWSGPARWTPRSRGRARRRAPARARAEAGGRRHRPVGARRCPPAGPAAPGSQHRSTGSSTRQAATAVHRQDLLGVRSAGPVGHAGPGDRGGSAKGAARDGNGL